MIRDMTFLWQQEPWKFGTNPFTTAAWDAYVVEMKEARRKFSSGVTPENIKIRNDSDLDDATKQQYVVRTSSLSFY
jgi:hypothetical protein